MEDETNNNNEVPDEVVYCVEDMVGLIAIDYHAYVKLIQTVINEETWRGEAEVELKQAVALYEEMVQKYRIQCEAIEKLKKNEAILLNENHYKTMQMEHCMLYIKPRDISNKICQLPHYWHTAYHFLCSE